MDFIETCLATLILEELMTRPPTPRHRNKNARPRGKNNKEEEKKGCQGVTLQRLNNWSRGRHRRSMVRSFVHGGGENETRPFTPKVCRFPVKLLTLFNSSRLRRCVSYFANVRSMDYTIRLSISFFFPTNKNVETIESFCLPACLPATMKRKYK